MCLIVFTPNISKAKFNFDILERGYELNDDGAGVSFVRDGQVVTEKGFETYDAFKDAFIDIIAENTGPMIVHFRKATCGSNNNTNTQPVEIIPGGLVMAHNGIIGSLSYTNSKTSDSVRLSKIIKGLNWTLPLTLHQYRMLEAICDSGNKLVFIDALGKYEIINASAGTWKKNIWYSNEWAFSTKNKFEKIMQRDIDEISRDLDDIGDQAYGYAPLTYKNPWYSTASAVNPQYRFIGRGLIPHKVTGD